MYSDCSQQDIMGSLNRSWDSVKHRAKKLGFKRNLNKAHQPYSEEHLITKLKELGDLLGKTPREIDMRNADNFPSSKPYKTVFGNWNNALRMAGFTLNTEFNIDKNEIIKRAREYFKKYGKSPCWDDLSISRTVYVKYWDSFADMLLDANLPLNREIRVDHFKTNEELISDYKNLYLKLKRIPIAQDIDCADNTASFKTYKKRFGGYKEIWKACGIDDESIVTEGQYGFICLDKNGEVCKSYAEMVITNVLIDSNVEYKKEFLYENLIPELKSTRYAMDWYLPKYDVCVEYFGIYKRNTENDDTMIGKYTRKAIWKMSIAKENNINLIDIYQEDLNETYLKRLVSKFNNYGINLIIESKNLYKNKSVV